MENTEQKIEKKLHENCVSCNMPLASERYKSDSGDFFCSACYEHEIEESGETGE